MLYLVEPQYLWLLLLIPAILIAYGIGRIVRKRMIATLGDAGSVSALMPSWSGTRGWLKLIFFCLGLLCLILALSRPQTGAKLKTADTKGSEIMICLDVSNSMLAEDYTPSRLDRAKLAISRIVDKLDGDRVGLVIFAGKSFVQLPVTVDYVSAKMFLESVNTSSIQVQGTALADAISTAVQSFSSQSDKGRAIIVITDGENHEDDPVAAAKSAAEAGIKVYTIGVGSPEGKSIPYGGSVLKDEDGNIVVTKLNEDILKKVAIAGGGAYVHAVNEEFGLNPIIDEINRLEKEKHNSTVFEEYNEIYMYFLGAALLFFALEMLIGNRRSKRNLF